MEFALLPGQVNDAPEGRKLLLSVGKQKLALPLLMDRASERDETRQLALELGFNPIVPPKSNRLEPWEYDHKPYKKRNEIEGLFHRLKGESSRAYRRIAQNVLTRPRAYLTN